MLKKVQELPIGKKKMILWMIVSIVSVFLVVIQYNFIVKRIEEIDFSSSPVNDLGNEFRPGVTGITEEIRGLEESLRDVTEEMDKVLKEEQEEKSVELEDDIEIEYEEEQ